EGPERGQSAAAHAIDRRSVRKLDPTGSLPKSLTPICGCGCSAVLASLSDHATHPGPQKGDDGLPLPSLAESPMEVDRSMQDKRLADGDQDAAAAAGRGIAAAAERSSEDDFEEIKRAVLAKLTLSVGKDPGSATDRDWFVAAAFMARDRIIHRWLAAER